MPVLLSETERKLKRPEIDNLFVRERPKQPLRRSSGAHVGGIISHVLETIGKQVYEAESEEFPLRMAVGRAWEEWAIGLWPEMVWQPRELELDRIFGTPDGLTHDPRRGCDVVEEFKATWYSRKKLGHILNQRRWKWQIMAYCHMLGLRHARLHILYINGDYDIHENRRDPPAPIYMLYELEFSTKELQQFWNNVMLKSRDKARKEVH